MSRKFKINMSALVQTSLKDSYSLGEEGLLKELERNGLPSGLVKENIQQLEELMTKNLVKEFESDSEKQCEMLHAKLTIVEVIEKPV